MAGKHRNGLFAKFAESLPKSRYAEDARIGFAPKPWPGRDARTKAWSEGFRGFSVARRSRAYLYFLLGSYFQWE